MNDPFSKTPVELWEELQEMSRENAIVRRVLVCKQFHHLSPEHAALGLAMVLLDHNKELEKHVLEFYQSTPLATFMQPKG